MDTTRSAASVGLLSSDRRLSCTVTGPAAGPTLVTVHGVTGSSAALHGQTVHLADDGYRVITVDMLGHGSSPRFSADDLKRAAAPDAAVDTMIDLVEEIAASHGPVGLIGHSMGGAVMAEVAVRVGPEKVACAVLEDPAWLTEEQADGYRERGPRGASDDLVRARRDPGAVVKELVEQRPQRAPEDAVVSVLSWMRTDPELVRLGQVAPSTPWQDVAAALKVPTMVITSDTSEVLVGADQRRELEVIGNELVEVAEVPNAGHGVRQDQPEGFFAVVDPFLAEHLR
ncbi:alpha/beta hydrolase [Helcobacillus massiliensis]|uniref:alpha/beta fold hydrolase n=1 Tax=Helcobacillus massiliensis TaxID=521392 RepID=UPI0021A4E9B3|nr:alpha/beta hydrolase [Helcobacillus massiliensis]MCT1557618.1 alpha/beta hydrolase [Helcobacillus massiliensis]MCT2035890.1 alpha/beta hydrolase [Helcobacillus massiliensis]MCT2331840.1 alpha/beta hydrolase [Helcobacillus massiliensis]